MIYPTVKQNFLLYTHPIKYSEFVEKYAEEFGINKYLLYSFINVESGFDPEAVSDVGAIGLTQITEETFSWIKSKMCDKDTEYRDLFEPETSIKYGAYLISRSLCRYGRDVSTAAAAYHSGWGTVDRLLSENNEEILTEFPYANMNNYVYKINKTYSVYKQLYETEKG